ncbi:MAG TPA: sensor histidine kinase [Ktedonobacteraceae bacterium]
MSQVARFCTAQIKRWRLSLFEKVILANSLMLIGEALVGLWVTSHSLEAHHYLIDTSFIVAATLLTLAINVILLRASFRPLFNLLWTIRAISAGKTQARANVTISDSEIAELAQAFNGMLDQLEATRREQAMLILQAQEEERRRLSLELHDESSQTLTALLIHVEILNQSLQALPAAAIAEDAREQLGAGLNNLTRLSQDTLENIRTLAQQLRPGVLDDLGLHAAFRWLAEDSRQRLQLPVELHLENVENILKESDCSALYETTLFRIAQESLTNVARHAHAQHISISLTHEQQHICLQISDDGCGFDSSQRHAGLGIAGMRERAALLDGNITVRTLPGQGTTVEVILPLPMIPAKEVVHEC